MDKEWDDIPPEDKKDLLDWYNVYLSSYDDEYLRDEIGESTLRSLADLYHAGRFEAWDCSGCGERVYRGTPENLDDFQGVLNQDFSSYPGDPNKHGALRIWSQCDSCRCHGEPA